MRFILFAFIACLIPGSFVNADTSAVQSWLQAIGKRDSEKLKMLMPYIGNVDLQTLEGKTALMVAATKGDSILLSQLLERDAQLNMTNHRGGSALMYAAANNRLQAVKILLQNGADINMRAQNGWTALTLSAAKGYADIVSRLLSSGADPNIPDVYGWTALMRAIEHGHDEAAKLLAQHKSLEIDRINDRGQSALHIAAMMKNCEMIKFLIRHGADTQIQDFQKIIPEYKSFCEL